MDAASTVIKLSELRQEGNPENAIFELIHRVTAGGSASIILRGFRDTEQEGCIESLLLDHPFISPEIRRLIVLALIKDENAYRLFKHNKARLLQVLRAISAIYADDTNNPDDFRDLLYLNIEQVKECLSVFYPEVHQKNAESLLARILTSKNRCFVHA